MPKRRGVISLLLLAFMLVVAAGCRPGAGDQPGKTDAAVSKSGGVVTIRVATVPQTEESLMVDLLTEAFQDRYQQYRIEKVSLGDGDFHARIAELYLTGEVDLVALIGDQERDMLQPLDPFIARSGLDLKPYGSMLDWMRTDAGTLSEMPIGLRPSMLVYNKEMLQAAGIKEPVGGWTWDEFRQALRTLSTGTGEERVWGLDTIKFDYLARAYVEEKTGGPFWKAPPEVVGEALQFLSTMVSEDHSMPRPDVPKSTGGGPLEPIGRAAWQSFFDRKSAMALEHPISPASLRAIPLPAWGIAPMPTHPGTRPAGVGQAISLGIFQKAPQPDAAWEFLRFAAGEEGATVLARAGFTTVYVSDAVREAWGQRPKVLPEGADTIWQTHWVPWWPVSQDWRRQESMFRLAVNQTLSGAATWETALENYTKAIQAHQEQKR